ncbi:MAG TPA: hypothetical protein DEQ47_19815 [Solibacterales bacterium]|nr:hypothetical protein [Bryobacterales bacterium]
MNFRKGALGASLILLGAMALASPLPAADVTTIPVPNHGAAVQAAVGRDGTIHLLYDLGDIPYYVRSRGAAVRFGEPIPVVDAASRKPGLEFQGWEMAIGRDGAVYVAMSTNNWKAKLPGVPEGLLFTMLAPGAKAFTPVRSLNGRPSEGFSLAADGRGRVTATWLANKLYANFSNDDGATFTANAELNPVYDPCNCCTTRATYAGNGALAVMYREKTNDDRDIYVVVRKADGSLTRNRISATPWHINACPMTYYDITPTDSGYLAAWPTKGEIYFAALDREGKVLPPGEIKTPGHSGMRTGIVALASDGKNLIAWNNKGELNWQLYDRQGQPCGPAAHAATTGKGAAGVVDRGGHFLLFL